MKLNYLKLFRQEMLFFLTLLGSCWLAQSVSYRKLYKDAVIHYKDPDFEAGKTGHLTSTASNLLRDAAHYKAFKKNAMFVEKHNREDNLKWVATINEFSLETDEEFSHHLGLNMTTEIDEEIQLLQRAKRSTVDLALRDELEAGEVDYRSYLPPIKNQGGCGSCWTFGAMAALEYQVNKDRPVDGEMVALSEEQCVDCTSSSGCGGGWPTTCYTWGHYHYNHWASSYNYLYEGRNGLKCRYDDYKDGMSGFKFTKPSAQYLSNSDEDVLYAVANNRIGVLSCAIQVADGFGSYSSGVYSSENCNGGVNHAVNIVGYGTLNGIPYWKVRNSWGSGWGDGGYINMERGVNGNNLNMCHLTQYAHYPYIEGSDDGQGSGTESEAMRFECGDGGQVEYRGVVNQTASGRTCQKWSSQDPHVHSRTPQGYPYSGLEENYCRNPDGESGAWCYTTDSYKRWELCTVPDCSLEKWCELSDHEYEDELDGSAVYDDLDGAKVDCYKNDSCSGISQFEDGKYHLMTGPLTNGTDTVPTFQKGLCKQLTEIKPAAGKYCKMENVTLTSYLTSASTLLEAKQLCRHLESCGGVSGREGSFYLYSSKMSSPDVNRDTWFKDDCPDLTKCGFGKQADYRGNISTTANGRTCQRWDSQSPHSHSRTPENYPNSGLEENYCRNPDGKDYETFLSALSKVKP